MRDDIAMEERNRRDGDHLQRRMQRTRGTIHVTRDPLPSDAKWHGAAPRPLEPEKRTFRPRDLVF